MRLTPDQKGQIDRVTRNLAIDILGKAGYNEVRELRPEGVSCDLVVRHKVTEAVVLVEVEKSSLFRNGVYNSSEYNCVTIPMRKISFINLSNSLWLCVSWDNRHYIALPGKWILNHGKIISFVPRNTGMEERFYAVPTEQAPVQLI